MSYTARGMTIDFDTGLINVLSPATALAIQDLIDTIREAEASEEGICFDSIASASGKESLGGSISVGMTVNLATGWQVKWYAGSYQASIGGGNLVGGPGGVPVAYTPNVQVLLTQSANATLVETGVSGLTAEESTKLTNAETRVTEAWQRLGLDPSNPVVNHPDGSFDVGDIDVNASEAGGSITQTRQ